MAVYMLRGGARQLLSFGSHHLLRKSLVTTSTSSSPRVLITGGLGQLGSGVAKSLRNDYGKNNIILSDKLKPSEEILSKGPFIHADVCDLNQLHSIVEQHNIDWVVHFAALLSAIGEQDVKKAKQVNIFGVDNVLEVCKEHKLRVFIPSTIGAFGESSPRDGTPDLTIQRPRTIYGVAKVYTELLGEYYLKKFNLDFRSLRFPGVISVDTPPGGGTTDYAVHMVQGAMKDGHYKECFLEENTRLPMIYYPDVIKATRLCLDAPKESFRRSDGFMRTYNIQALSFTPAELADELKKHFPDFQLGYKVDEDKQKIADSWPRSLDDTWAKEDLGWKPDYGDLGKMVKDAVENMPSE